MAYSAAQMRALGASGAGVPQPGRHVLVPDREPHRPAAILAHRDGLDGYAATQWADLGWRSGLVLRPMGQALTRIVRALGDMQPAAVQLAAKLAEDPDLPVGPRERALHLRRTRNTGPVDRRGLDGHHRRRNR